MAELTARQRETAADIRLYVEIGLNPVVCGHCGVEAMVKKNSPQHTSIQWSAQAVTTCPEIAAARADAPGSLLRGCPRMRASIDDAVASGDLVVPDA